MIEIRRFEEKDAEPLSRMIINTLWESNIKDYSEEYVEATVKEFSPELVSKKASWTHFYVATDGEDIIGCGAIGPYYNKEDESSLFSIFVNSTCQKQGVGRKIIECLEGDEYFLRAKRIEIPASKTALNFYRKFGYDFKDGTAEVDEEGLYKLEKFRE